MTEPLVMFVAWIVIGIVVFAVAPLLPAWVGFVIPLGVVVYGIVELVRDGPRASEVALVLVFSTLITAVWWKQRRGTRGGRSRGT